MKKKILLTLTTVFLCLFALGLTASAETYGDLTYKVTNGEVTITDCNTSVTSVTVPATIDGYPVTSIGDYAFYGYSSLTSIDLPDCVTSIGSYAFYNTGYYNNANNWEDNVLYIGKHLIEAKTSISGKYTVKAGTKTIANYAFEDCSRLTSIDLPDSVTSIGDHAFEDCSSLTSIDLPDSVTSIGDSAFYNTGYYNNANNWEDDVLYIGKHLIEAKNSISGKYTVKAGTKTIAGEAFYNCSRLTSIELPDSVTSIGDFAFYNCRSLTSIELPDSVTSIGSSAFSSCISLTSIDVGENNRNYSSENGVLFDKEKKTIITYPAGKSDTSYIIPDSITIIGNYAFYYCRSLTSIELPDSVTSIGRSTFDGCSSLKSIDLPDCVTSIDSYAFDGCSSLKTVYYRGTEEDWNNIDIGSENSYLINAERKYICYAKLIDENGEEIIIQINRGSLLDISQILKEGYTVKLYSDENFVNEVELNNPINENCTLYYKYVVSQYTYKFVDEDGTVLKETTVDHGMEIVPPTSPSDKDPYTFDHWKNYTEGMVATENATFKAVYKYKDYKITAEGLEADVTVTYNSEFNIPPREKTDYNFIGYFTEADGKGEKITDENGNSLKAYDVVGDLKVYPYFEALNKIAVSGNDSAMLGDEISREIVFATNKNAQYLIMTVKHPESLILKEIINKDFIEIYKDSETVSDGYKILSLTCLYDYEGNNVPVNEEIVPVELKFGVATDAELGEIEISIEEAILVGDEDYEITEKINSRLEILPKLAEKIEISGSEKIEMAEKYIAIVSPEYTTNKEVTWTVSDETVATISQDGVLTPLKNGTVTITATAKDGSGVYAKKTVQVVTYAKLTSLDFGDGVCLDAFDPFKREYTVYVKSDATKITLTPKFSGGVLRPNGSGIWISGRAMDFALNGDETVITLNRENVKDMENNVYTIRVIKYDYATKTDISADGKTFVVTPIYSENGETVILALFDGDSLIGMQSAVYEGEEITFVTDKEYTMAKVMVWDSLENLSPSGKAEIIE